MISHLAVSIATSKIPFDAAGRASIDQEGRSSLLSRSCHRVPSHVPLWHTELEHDQSTEADFLLQNFRSNRPPPHGPLLARSSQGTKPGGEFYDVH
eukprot:CAMPEP_0172748406 /NCGR_PEP_ID=MMETSP1074-20121228/144995_1 /TAXON_ID=2916 /ORGANISM="Ceratium fusus, Strain PA161109" /LENGTH=95 /DNA_ID=CAMNT_0013580135 /DNA_START=814 /DNA_END=1101 /DNA_ORIENTATION=-